MFFFFFALINHVVVCFLALIPLVRVGLCLLVYVTQLPQILFLQLHDLTTRELLTRIGGAKTGLMHASMVSLN